MPSLAEHEAVKGYLNDLTRRPDTMLVVTPNVLHELVHVVTDGRRFEPPVSMAEAMALARRYVDRSNVVCVAITAEAITLALDLIDQHGLGRKRIAETLLAATYRLHGVENLVTCDPGGFGIVEGLQIIDPRSPPS
jgi:predicted nucleic acid-binding protein